MQTSPQATRMFYRRLNGHVESNDRSEVHAKEEGKRETVSDLRNAWNNGTAEVLDVYVTRIPSPVLTFKDYF